jgi:hypothetical protein
MTRSACMAIAALLVLAAGAVDTSAQWLPEPAAWMAGDAERTDAPGVPSWGSDATRLEPVRLDNQRIVLTTLGAVGGFAAGAMVGAIGIPGVLSIWASEPFPSPTTGDGHVLESHHIAAGGVAVAAGLGGAILGAPLGAHVAHGRRGNLWLGMLGSVVPTATAGWLITRRGDGTEAFLAVPLMSIGTSAAIELLTTR